jgi:hypothetical protein
MKAGVLATMIFGALIGYPIASFAGLAPDADGDGVPDVLDNCLNVSNAGTLDCDTDQDGYGNRCDCDLNEASGCNVQDLNIWKNAFKASHQTNLHADLNCSGGATPLNVQDLNIWKNLFKTIPHVSGLSCANPNLAGSCPN